MMQNYEQIIDFIARTSGLSVEDIERRIEAKRAKLSGLISKEGAAQVVAAELGINFDKQKMKIAELISGMKRVNVVGKIVNMNRVIEYNKNGRQGKIGSFLLADETSNIRTVLWDTNHIELIEKNQINEADVVEIANASIRNSELHLTGFSEIKKSEAVIENVKSEMIVSEKAIEHIEPNNTLQVRAFVVQIFGPNFFQVCPECGKKVSEAGECEGHGKIVPQKRAILSFILDDGTGTIRAALFSEQIEKIADNEEIENPEKFMSKRDELLGKEFIITASARKNKLYENTELIVSDIKDIDIDGLIEGLEG